MSSMKKLTTLFSIFYFLFSVSSFAQDLPKTTIFTSDFSKAGKEMTFAAPQKITDFIGYNNQPFFMPDEQTILFVSVRENKHADIYSYDSRSKVTTDLTNTPDVSEYSPQITPDKKHITVVRVEKDDSTQHLYQYDLDGKNPELLLPKINPIGYYCRLNDTLVSIFVLGKPNTLQIANLRTGKAIQIDTGIGRCMQLIPGKKNTFSYIFKYDSTVNLMMSYNFVTKEKETICMFFNKTEDYLWTSDNLIWYGANGKMMQRDTDNPDQPKEIFDFNTTPCANFYRIVLDPYHQRIAMVSYEGKKP